MNFVIFQMCRMDLFFFTYNLTMSYLKLFPELLVRVLFFKIETSRKDLYIKVLTVRKITKYYF